MQQLFKLYMHQIAPRIVRRMVGPIIGLMMGVIVIGLQTPPVMAYSVNLQLANPQRATSRPPLVVQSRRHARERNPVQPAPRAEVETVIRPASTSNSTASSSTATTPLILTTTESGFDSSYRGPLIVRERE